jgi:HSP20 family protein
MPASRRVASTAGLELLRLSRGLLDLDSRLGADAGWPRVELLELPGRLRVVADLPGVAPRSLRVELHGHELRLLGNRREPRPAAAGTFLLRERPQGRFTRDVTLPRDVDPRRARARLEAGRLTVELPETRPRAVRVRVREGGAR